MDKLLYRVSQADDIWGAFVTQMPEEHKNLNYCKAFIDTIRIYKSDPPAFYYNLCKSLLKYGAITSEIFTDCCRLLPVDERIQIIYDSGRFNKRIMLPVMRSLYPNIPAEKITLNDKLFRIIVRVALENNDNELLRLVLKCKSSYIINGLTKVLRNFDKTEALLVLRDHFHIDTDEVFYNKLYLCCHNYILPDIIVYVCNKLKISIRDLFISKLPRDGIYIRSFVNSFNIAGLNVEEIYELNKTLKNKSVQEWLDNIHEDV